jgi:hypothetical protein
MRDQRPALQFEELLGFIGTHARSAAACHQYQECLHPANLRNIMQSAIEIKKSSIRINLQGLPSGMATFRTDN